MILKAKIIFKKIIEIFIFKILIRLKNKTMSKISKLCSVEQNMKNIIIYVITHKLEKRLNMVKSPTIRQLEEIVRKLFILCEKIIEERCNMSLQNCKNSLYDIENYKNNMMNF